MDILRLEKWPILLSLLTTGFSYQFNKMIGYDSNKPILAMKRHVDMSGKINDSSVASKVSFTLINLSDTSVFKNLHIICVFKDVDARHERLADPRKVTDPEIIPVSPAPFIDSLPEQLANDEGVTFFIPVMYPQNSYVLHFKTIRHISIDEYPYLYVTADQGIQFRLYGLEERMLNHSFIMNVILLGIWIVLLIIYFRITRKSVTNEKKIISINSL